METSPLLVKGCKFFTSALMAIEQCRFLSAPHLLWHGASVYNGLASARTRDTHTYCRAFSSGAVATCFYDLGLSRLGFEHPMFRLRGKHSNPLRHRRGWRKLIWQVENKYYLTKRLIKTNIYKKHIDASVKERPQTLLVPSEEICKRVLCNKHI